MSKITTKQAEDILIEKANKNGWVDELYSLVHDKFMEFVKNVEQENEIFDVDGNKVNSEDFSEDGSEWYDDVHDEFVETAFDAIIAILSTKK